MERSFTTRQRSPFRSASSCDLFVSCNSSEYKKKDNSSIFVKNDNIVPYKKHNSYKKRPTSDHDHENSQNRIEYKFEDFSFKRVSNEESITTHVSDNMLVEKKKKKHRGYRNDNETQPEIDWDQPIANLSNAEDLQSVEPRKKKKKKRHEESFEIEIHKHNLETSVHKDTAKKKNIELEEGSSIYAQVSKLVDEVVKPEEKRSKKRKKQIPEADYVNSSMSEIDSRVALHEENRALLNELTTTQNERSTEKDFFENLSGFNESTPKKRIKKRKKPKPVEVDECIENSNGNCESSYSKKKAKSVRFSIEFTPKEEKNGDESFFYDAGKELQKTLLENIDKLLLAATNKPHKAKETFHEIPSIEREAYDEFVGDTISEDQLSKLKHLHVMLPWPTPPLHKLETRIVAKRNEAHNIRIADSGCTVKSGIYSRKEDDQIRANWENFCKYHDLKLEDHVLFTSLIHQTKKRTFVTLQAENKLNFCRFIAHGLDDRLLTSVYHRFKRLYAERNMKQGRFTQDEDDILLDYVLNRNDSTPFAHLSRILRRTPISIEKRFFTLTRGGAMNTPVDWDETNVKELIRIMLKVTKLQEKNDLKDRELSVEEWKKVSLKLGFSWDQLQRSWNYILHPRVFVQEGTMSHAMKFDLIYLLHARGENDWKTVDWRAISEDFEGFNRHKLSKMFKHTVNYHVPRNLHHDLASCLHHLVDVALPNHKFFARKLTKLDV